MLIVDPHHIRDPRHCAHPAPQCQTCSDDCQHRKPGRCYAITPENLLAVACELGTSDACQICDALSAPFKDTATIAGFVYDLTMAGYLDANGPTPLGRKIAC